ncbi:MAG: four helix bundle protein [Tenuifilaceae bacterium]
MQKRLFNFSVRIILALRELPNSNEYRVISYQLAKSSTSTSANYEEAQAAVSRNDFSNKIGISLKEIRESNYWIRLINAISKKIIEWDDLEKESEELMKILGSIYTKTSKPR